MHKHSIVGAFKQTSIELITLLKLLGSLFCLSNITAVEQEIQLSAINLIDTEQWMDLIGGDQYESREEVLRLRPYQTVWISNLAHYEQPL